jgi:hypothetical protein
MGVKFMDVGDDDQVISVARSSAQMFAALEEIADEVAPESSEEVPTVDSTDETVSEQE